MWFTSANSLAMIAVVIAWALFFVPFMLKRRTSDASAGPTKRDSISLAGIALQGVAFAFVYMGIITPGPLTFDSAIVEEAVLPAVLAFSGLLLFAWSYLALGSNWSFVARVRSDHGLITGGPFALVRNPIYLAMMLMLIAAALAFGHLQMLLFAVPLFFIGTVIRVLREERLLRAQFGEMYDAYAARTSRLIPGVW